MVPVLVMHDTHPVTKQLEHSCCIVLIVSDDLFAHESTILVLEHLHMYKQPRHTTVAWHGMAHHDMRSLAVTT